MSLTPLISEIGPKIRLVRARCAASKTSCISILLQMPLQKYTAEYFILSSFLSHVSKKYPTMIQLHKKLEDLYGAMLSTDVRKLGESYCMRFSITCLSDALALDEKTPLSESALALLLELLWRPYAENGAFHEKQFETELRIAVEDIESALNDKRAYALGRMIENMCKNEAYGMSKETLLKQVKKVTPESLFTAWECLLREAVIHITVVGEKDFAFAEDFLKAAFAKLPDRAPVSPTTRFVSSVSAVKEIAEEMEMEQSKLVLGFRTDMQHKDDRYYAYRIMADIFGGGPYSRLFNYVREKLSLCYYCSARLDKFKGILVVQSGIEKKNKEKAQAEILHQLEIMQKGEFTDAEFEASKAALCDLFRGIEDTAEGIDAFYAFKAEGKIETPQDVLKGLSAVTKEDVIAAANGVTLDTVYLLAGKEAV